MELKYNDDRKGWTFSDLTATRGLMLETSESTVWHPPNRKSWNHRYELQNGTVKISTHTNLSILCDQSGEKGNIQITY